MSGERSDGPGDQLSLAPGPALPTSRTGRQLRAVALAAGWTVHVTPGHGTTDQTYLGPPRGDGTRPRLTRTVPCQSEAIRMVAPDGRRAVAVIVTTDGKSWSGWGAWTWTPGQYPRPTSTRDLLALLALLRPAPAERNAA